MSDFKALYSTYSKSALRKIVYDMPEQYEEQALCAAKNELFGRYNSILTVNNDYYINFYDILRSVTFDEISEELKSKKQKSKILECEQMYKSLLLIEQASKFSLRIDLTVSKNGKWTFNIINADDEQEIYDEGLLLNDWLHIKIRKEDVIRYGAEAVIAPVLIKIIDNESYGYYVGTQEIDYYPDGIDDSEDEA